MLYKKDEAGEWLMFLPNFQCRENSHLISSLFFFKKFLEIFGTF